MTAKAEELLRREKAVLNKFYTFSVLIQSCYFWIVDNLFANINIVIFFRVKMYDFCKIFCDLLITFENSCFFKVVNNRFVHNFLCINYLKQADFINFWWVINNGFGVLYYVEQIKNVDLASQRYWNTPQSEDTMRCKSFKE